MENIKKQRVRDQMSQGYDSQMVFGAPQAKILTSGESLCLGYVQKRSYVPHFVCNIQPDFALMSIFLAKKRLMSHFPPDTPPMVS